MGKLVVGWMDLSHQGATFVAVGAAGKLATSDDGVTWTGQTSSFSTTVIWSVCWSADLQLLCAVGDSGKIATSPDGVTWTQRTSGISTSLRSVFWGSGAGVFVAVGSSGVALTSPDGVTWTSRTSSFGTNLINRVVWSSTNSRFVAVGNSSHQIATSSDGISWTQRTNPFTVASLHGLAWNGALGKFHASGSQGGTCQHAGSSDGITWSLWGTAPSDTSNVSAGFTTDSVSFIATGGGFGKLDTSTNGSSWTSTTLSSIGNISDMAYSASAATYLLVGDNGSTSPQVRTSPDGTTWTSRSIGAFSTSVVNGCCASS